MHYGRTTALFGLCLLAATGANATSISVTDVYTNDENLITQQKFTNTTLQVRESVGEDYTVPYPSHDGNGVVNEEGNYFDKVINFTDVTDNAYRMNFQVTNDTDYVWSDYHFEFWDATFTTRIADVTISEGSVSSNIFVNNGLNDMEGVNNTVLEFWAPDWVYQGDTATFTFKVNLFDMVGAEDGAIGIRQVATVPEPETYALMLAGLGLVGFASRRRKS